MASKNQITVGGVPIGGGVVAGAGQSCVPSGSVSFMSETFVSVEPSGCGALEIVAVHAKMRVLGISVITDQCLPDALEPVSLPEIIATANGAEGKLRVLVRRAVTQL